MKTRSAGEALLTEIQMSLHMSERLEQLTFAKRGLNQKANHHFEKRCEMNKCLSLVHLITIWFLPLHIVSAQTDLPQARIVNLSIDPEQVVVLHLRPGYVSSVRVLEEVSSVVLGDPGAFKGEHSEAEPRLVFFKVTSPKARTDQCSDHDQRRP